MREFNLVHKGASALIGSSQHWLDESMNIDDTGFRELDTLTGNVTFEWNARDHVHPSESLKKMPASGKWDYLYVVLDETHYTHLLI